MTIAITRTGVDAGGFRTAAGRTKDAAAARRMLALALVLEGQSRTEAAHATGIGSHTLRGHLPAGYAQHAREEGCIAITRKACRG